MAIPPPHHAYPVKHKDGLLTRAAEALPWLPLSPWANGERDLSEDMALALALALAAAVDGDIWTT
ncbi:hypothetical protein E4U40_006865 [Claviceps sp. LM458 group G5]|nr:hypothetical protein E4U40_006865 [Claviceps sp. LM458 group G5]